MIELRAKLTAANSTGYQELFLERNEDSDDYKFTLVGDYKDNHIQIDFDPMTAQDLKNLRRAILSVELYHKESNE